MRVFEDLFNREEIISDSYTIELKYNGVVGEVDSDMVTLEAEKFDVGCGDAFGGGAEDEKADDQAVKINNLINAFKYEETSHDKASFKATFKIFMKKVKEHLEAKTPARVEEFVKGATEAFTYILKNFDEFSFYTPPSFDTESTVIMSYYKEGAAAPTFMYFMDGLKGVKL